jgi:hypothetical protein
MNLKLRRPRLEIRDFGPPTRGGHVLCPLSLTLPHVGGRENIPKQKIFVLKYQ